MISVKQTTKGNMPAKVARQLKYITPDGNEWDTLTDAQRHEIEGLFPPQPTPTGYSVDDAAKIIVEKADAFVAVLRQKERKRASSAPKVRKPKTPKAKPTGTPAATP